MGAQAIRLSNVDIDKALDDGDFEILFQPIYNLSDGTLVRHETFVRWRHATLGLLPPGAFISFFETQGRMSELTRYVLNRAVEQYLSWRGPYGPGFSINLALSDVVDDSFAAHFEVAMRDRAFPTEHLTFECPMPPVNTNISTAISNYQRLAATGARLSIEVRGRANDFLKTIDPFPFSEIKTGGAAILRFARTVRGPGIASISELLELAADKGATITAVGVEDQASLVALRGIGFAAAQGNHLGRVGELSAFKPSKINEVRALLGLEAFSTDDLSALFRDSPSDGPTEASPSKADSDPVQPARKSAAKPRATRKKTKPSLDPIANNTVGTGSSSKSKLLSATAPATEKSVDAEELREAVLAKISQRKLTKPTLAESGRTTDKGTDKSGLEGRDQELVDKLSKRIARELNGTKDEMDLEAATNRKAVSLARSANRKPRKATSRKGDQRAAVKEALAPKAASEEDLLPKAEDSLSMDSDDSATTEAKAPVDKSHNEQEPLRQDEALVEPATSALLDGEEASNDLPLSDSGNVVPSKDDKPAKSRRKKAPSSRAKAKAKKATDNVSDASSAVNTTTEEAEAQHSAGEAEEEAAVAHKAPRKSRRRSDKDPLDSVEDLTGDLFGTLTDDSNDQSDAAAVFAADGSASTDDQKVDVTPTIPAILKSDIDKTVGGTDLPSAETADVAVATEETSGH
ncbi:MAG: EAL domain-containing protein, partial [Pseudomonadota bacterium]